MKRTLEVIATTAEDAIAAAEGGADRIEVVADLGAGGLTPPLGLVEEIMEAVKIDIQVMIRPHDRSFVYSELELAYMAGQIAAVRSLGRPGIVVGCLTAEGAVDERGLAYLLSYAGGLDVTFHRALDETADLAAAYEAISRFAGVRRVLTSGGASAAPSGADAIAALVRRSEAVRSGRMAPGIGAGSGDLRRPGPAVMAGSGLRAELLPAFLKATGARELHFGTGVRGAAAVDRAKVAEVRRLLDQVKS
ncbi:copper homeostasis protein [Cohnella sp. OV330]|uniref:copper homeostasis protein CutC n=1 Tax=Cohnella sp. OV330 TaxID=1855288 RepID=UPI0008E174A4|nr:copper homeostasis protein CutC [Cohnella sp. OV330]SFB57744.1 copper homeostasis protein [Cohnella sp. OV330]